MKLTNTYISDNCTKKCLVYVDENGHYNLIKKVLMEDGWERVSYGQVTFKKIESLNRAVNKWIK